jgi:hypothetical protein
MPVPDAKTVISPSVRFAVMVVVTVVTIPLKLADALSIAPSVQRATSGVACVRVHPGAAVMSGWVKTTTSSAAPGPMLSTEMEAVTLTLAWISVRVQLLVAPTKATVAPAALEAAIRATAHAGRRTRIILTVYLLT